MRSVLNVRAEHRGMPQKPSQLRFDERGIDVTNQSGFRSGHRDQVESLPSQNGALARALAELLVLRELAYT